VNGRTGTGLLLIVEEGSRDTISKVMGSNQGTFTLTLPTGKYWMIAAKNRNFPSTPHNAVIIPYELKPQDDVIINFWLPSGGIE
jgi:hypothetical protein